MELLQQQVSELEAQLSQQMTVRLHELVTSLSTSPNTNKQALGQQLAKVFEQCQTYPAPPTGVGLSNSLSHQQHQELECLDEPQNSAEAVVPLVQHLEGSISSPQSIVASNLNTPTSLMPQMSEIPQGYQVVSTTPEGHLVVSKTSELTVRTEPVIFSSQDTVVGKPDGIGVSLTVSEMSAVDVNKHSLIACNGSMTQDIKSVPGSIHEAISENIQESMSESIQESMSESIQESLSESIKKSMSENCIRDSNTSSLLNGELQQGESDQLGTMASEEMSLIHMISAADGLASLGTDVAVVTPVGTEDLPQDTFVIDIRGSQGLLVQKEVPVEQTFDNTTGQRGQHAATLDGESTIEPLAKKIRLAT